MIELLLAIGLLVAAGGNGWFVLQKMGSSFANKTEELSFSFAVGLGILILLVMGLGFAHLLYREAVVVLVVVWGIWGGVKAWGFHWWIKRDLSRFRPDFSSIYLWMVVLFSAGLVLGLIRAMVPPHGATDPLAYQLALPKIFLAKHFFSFEPTINGALYPANMGILFAVGLALQNGILAQMFHWLMGALTVLAIVGIGQHFFTYRVGIWGALIFSFTPVLVVFSPKGYIDLGLCFFQLMAFWALFNWLEKFDKMMLLLAGVLTGLAMGVKHQGISTLVAGLCIVGAGAVTRRARPGQLVRDGCIYGLMAVLLAAPWYLRSFFMAGNPIWPLANGYFGGEPYNQAVVTLYGFTGKLPQETSGVWALFPSLERFSERITSIWKWTFNANGMQEAIGVYFVALLPGMVILGRGKKVWILTAFCGLLYLMVIFGLNRNPRYGMVLFALLSVLCGYVIEQWRLREGSLWKITSGPSVVRSVAGVLERVRPLVLFFQIAFVISIGGNLLWGYWMTRPYAEVAFNRSKREPFLERTEGNYRVFRFINQHLPASAVVLFQGIVKGFYCEREYLWDHPHQAVIDYEDFKEPDQLLVRMKELNITHVVRMINIPSSRLRLGYPQYFLDPYHEEFRKKYLRLIYRDESYALFEVSYYG